MTVFFIVGGIGLVLLLGSMLLGEIMEFGDGLISGTSLGVGAVIFAATGVIATANTLSTWATFVGAVVLAALGIALVQYLIKKLTTSDDGTPPSAINMLGIVTSDITATGGEVALDAELERRLAWSDQTIPEGVRIVVLEQSGTRVRVAPNWSGTSGSGNPKVGPAGLPDPKPFG